MRTTAPDHPGPPLGDKDGTMTASERLTELHDYLGEVTSTHGSVADVSFAVLAQVTISKMEDMLPALAAVVAAAEHVLGSDPVAWRQSELDAALAELRRVLGDEQ
jgi:hypothetical protein